MGLRTYQQDCLAAVRAANMEGCSRQLITLPCGTGKTRVAAALPEAMDLQPWEQMLFLVHLDELAFQAVNTFKEINPTLRVGLEKAEYRAAPDSDIVVASIQTLARSEARLHKFDPTSIRVVYVDEAHHAVEPSFMKVLEYFGVLKGEPGEDCSRLLIGLTATARRHDAVGLERVFERIVYSRTTEDMIEEGWLAPPVAWRVHTKEDLDDVDIRMGDFLTSKLRQVCNTPERNALVVQKYLEYGAHLPALAFTVDIQHAEDLAATFRYHGLPFEALSGKTSPGECRRIIDAHRAGDLLGITSCAKISEGFDSPIATVGLMCRPTMSGLLYQQQLGRVLRPYPAPEARATHTGYVKERAIIVDLAGNSTRHRIYNISVLFGLSPDFNMNGRPVVRTVKKLKDLQEENPTLDLAVYAGLSDVEAAVSNVDLFRPASIPKVARSVSKFSWVQISEDVYRLVVPGCSISVVVDQLGKYHVWVTENGKRELVHTTTEPEEAFVCADAHVPDESVGLVLAKARWRGLPPKDGQLELLFRVDRGLRQRFSAFSEFKRFAMKQYHSGNKGLSRGAISSKLDRILGRDRAKTVKRAG